MCVSTLLMSLIVCLLVCSFAISFACVFACAQYVLFVSDCVFWLSACRAKCVCVLDVCRHVVMYVLCRFASLSVCVSVVYFCMCGGLPVGVSVCVFGCRIACMCFCLCVSVGRYG